VRESATRVRESVTGVRESVIRVRESVTQVRESFSRRLYPEQLVREVPSTGGVTTEAECAMGTVPWRHRNASVDADPKSAHPVMQRMTPERLRHPSLPLRRKYANQ